MFDFGETALILRPIILPRSYDFPEFTGPIRPIFNEYALGGLDHLPLYLSAKISYVC